MPITFKIDPDRSLILLEGNGKLTKQDLIDCLIVLRIDPNFQPGMTSLGDLSGVDSFDINLDDIKEVVDVMGETPSPPKKSKSIVVAPKLMHRMVATLLRDVARVKTRSPAFEIYKDIDEARRVLGLDDPVGS